MPISSRFVINSTIVLLTVGFLTLLSIVGMTIWLGEKAQIYLEDASASRDTRTAGVELRSAVQSAESSQRGFLVGGNEIYLAPYETAKTLSETQLERLKMALAASPQSGQMMKRLSDIISEKFDEMDRTIGLKNDLRDAEASTVFRSNRGKALMDEANVFLSSIIRATDERLTAGGGGEKRKTTRVRWVFIFPGLGVGVVVWGGRA